MRKIIVILIGISAIANIFAGVFIYLDLQVIKAPDTTIRMEILEINSNNATVQSTLDISNPNSFDIIVKDLIISMTTPSSEVISRLRIDGENIPANSNKTFIENSIINYQGFSPEKIITEISGVVGFKTFFIEKTLPISLKVISDMEEIFSNIFPPTMSIITSFGKISQDNVSINVEVQTFNPNNFDIKIEDMYFDIKNDKGEDVGILSLPIMDLSAKSSSTVNVTGFISIESLNADSIYTNISANVRAIIAGYGKTLPFAIESRLIDPDLKDLLPSVYPTNAILRSDYRATLTGLISDITLEVHNPNEIEFDVKDITLEIFRIDKNSRRLISEGTIEEGKIKSNTISTFKGSISIPYHKIYIPDQDSKFLPEWFEVRIRANVTIQGLDNYLWIGLVAYQDLRFWKSDVVYDNPTTVEWL